MERTFAEGETVVKQGDMADAFYIVKSGVLACSVRKNADNEAGTHLRKS